MSEKDARPVSLPRDMISVVCPCCGELVPVELILNAGDLSRYLDIVGINEGGYTDADCNKRWPVVALEVKADERRLIDDTINRMLKRYEDAKARPMPEQ